MIDQEEAEVAQNKYELSEQLTPKQARVKGTLATLSINLQSINNKFQGLRDLVHNVDPTVICTQEIWKANPGTDYSIRGFGKPLLRTRHTMGSTRMGGGVGIWVKDDIDIEEIDITNKEGIFESNAVHLPKHNLTILNIYRPPGDEEPFIDLLLENLKKIKKKYMTSDLQVVGDFNIDLSLETNQSTELISSMLEFNLVQQVTAYTRVTKTSRSLIDHVYIKTKGQFKTDVLITDLSDHYAVLSQRISTRINKAKTMVTKRWFTKEAYENLQVILAATDWSPMDNMNTDEAASYLEQQIIEASDIVAPILTKTIKIKKVNQWTTPGLRISLETNCRNYKSYKKLEKLKKDATEERNIYKAYKKVLSKVIAKAKQRYYKDLIKEAGEDTKRLWQILNEMTDRKQIKHKYPTVFQKNGHNISDKKEIANLFNSYFASIGKQMADSQPDVPGFETHLKKVDSVFRLHTVAESHVKKIMQKQQPKLSCGIDTINNKLVKTCHEQLAKPMTIVINKSITDSTVPLNYKTARVIPLYKKGSPSDCGNYRPVSLLSALSKILEKVICKQLNEYLEKNNLLCQDQFGFRRKCQTTHVVQKLLNEVSDNANNNEVTIATYLDLSKAFDCIQYDKLYTKLYYLGFDNRTIEWFKSYLSQRKQLTDLDGTHSDWEEVTLGVPQGSILGPILFLLYVNDINNSDKNANFDKFADDTTVLTKGKTIEEASEKMNSSMKNIHLWFAQNKLNLNPTKTRYSIFKPNKNDKDINNDKLVKIGDHHLQRVWRNGKETAFKLVGIWIDEELTWGEHIEKTRKKINSALYGLSKTKKYLSRPNKTLLYMGLIQSHLTYGSPIWGHAKKTKLQPLRVAQKKAIRKIHNLEFRAHTHEHFIKSKILKLDDLLRYTTLTYIHSSIHETSPVNVRQLWKIKPQNPILRDRGIKLDMHNSKKQWFIDLPNNKQTQIWDQCPVDTSLEPNPFKHRLKTHYISQYCQSLEQ